MKSILFEMADAAKRMNMKVYSITEILDGTVQTVHLEEDSRCRNLYSVSKAFTMAAIGMLYDDGLLSPESTVSDIFGTLAADAKPGWGEVTVHDALRHRTGLTESATDIDIDSDRLLSLAGRDWLHYLFTLPLDGIRGETYHYTDTAYYLLSCMVTSRTGKCLSDFLRDRLFVPLEFKEYAWSTCPAGYAAGGSGLYLSCEDMAKLGKLWLDEGKCGEKRILSQEWIDLSLQNDYAFSKREEKRCGYYKTGANSQMLYFSPEDNRVIALQAFAPASQRTELIDLFL